MVAMTEHEDLSRETVRRRLAEDELKPWRRDMWCIPQVDGNYAARMEDVLGCSQHRTPRQGSHALTLNQTKSHSH